VGGGGLHCSAGNKEEKYIQFLYQRREQMLKFKTASYKFSMKLFPAGSSRMNLNDESPAAQALNFNKNWSIASAVFGSTFW